MQTRSFILRTPNQVVNMKPLDSSNISHWGWKEGNLYLAFHSTPNKVYVYSCPPGTLKAFRDAESKGKFFYNNLKEKLLYTIIIPKRHGA